MNEGKSGSNKTCLITILVVVCVCVLGTFCSAAGAVGYRLISRGGTTPAGKSTAPESSTPAPRATIGGTLRLSGGLPPTLDPAMVQDSTSAEYVTHLFSGLVSLNEKLEIVPDLATRWEVSADGRTYTFHLVPDATFADGKPLQAADVLYSIERACSPKLQSPVASSYLDDIVGVSQFMAGRAEHISGLQAVDERTVQITIDAPKAYFLAKLTYSTAFVVDQAQIKAQGEGWLTKPNGSGPFVLQSLDRSRVVLARNPRYYGKQAALDKVEFLLGGGVPITMYENDQLDIVGVPSSEIERVLDPENPLHAEHYVAPELSVQYLGLNMAMPPFDDPLVRQAFAHAIDKDKIADLVLQGTAAAARGILPPSLPDYDESFTGLAYDPAQARQLLASSKYGQPGAMPPVVLAVSGTSGHMPDMAGAVLGMIEENLGITVTVEQVEWSAFLQDLNQRRYQIYSAGWIGDYPDAQDFLDFLFHSDSAQNHTGYANAQVDQLLEQARVEGDPAKRTALYRQAERMIINDAPWIPLTHGISYTLVKPYVRGFAPSAALYPWLREISIQK